MTPYQQSLHALVFSMLAVPLVLAGISWYRLAKSPIGDGRSKALWLVVLLPVTCSQVFLILGLVAKDVIGPDYSSRRFTTILVNLVAMILATVLAAVIRRQGGRVLVVSCAWATCSWLYAAVVSSAV